MNYALALLIGLFAQTPLQDDQKSGFPALHSELANTAPMEAQPTPDPVDWDRVQQSADRVKQLMDLHQPALPGAMAAPWTAPPPTADTVQDQASQTAPLLTLDSPWEIASALAEGNERQRQAIEAARRANESELAAALVDSILGGAGEAAANIVNAAPYLPQSLTQPLLRILREGPTVEHQCAAAYLLGALGAAEARLELSAAAQATDPQLAPAAAAALARMNDLDLVPVWTQLLLSANPAVCATALEALALLPSPAGMDAIAHVAMGAVRDSRLQALALEKVAGWSAADAIPTLIRVMRRNFSMRTGAWRYLMQITGESIPEVPSEWERWYEQIRNPPEPPLVPAAPIPDSELLNEVEFVPPPLRAAQ